MMKSALVLLCAAVLLLLGGCKAWRGANACSKPQPYMAATSVPALKIPQGLDAPDTSTALKLPTLNEPVARYGPFVMNTAQEIRQAAIDYHAGRF